jgi:hypothetical protein
VLLGVSTAWLGGGGPAPSAPIMRGPELGPIDTGVVWPVPPELAGRGSRTGDWPGMRPEETPCPETGGPRWSGIKAVGVDLEW